MITIWVSPHLPHNYPQLADEAGCNKVVASVSLVAEPCQEAGKDVNLIQIAEEAVQSALQQRLITIGVRQREQIKTERFRQSLDTVTDGFIATDEMGKVAVFNRRMELITGIYHQEILGLEKGEAMRRFPLISEVFSHDDGDLLEHNGETCSVLRARYAVADLLLQEIVRLMSVPELQKIEGNLRKNLSEKGVQAKNSFANLYYECSAMRVLKEKAQKYAASSSCILITGESGTGKEVLAQSIHNASAFKAGPFVAINCAALPETLRESELFGYEEGVFREDLYYRINVLSLAIPPLRERENDVKFLARRLLLKKCKEAHRYVTMSESAIDYLQK